MWVLWREPTGYTREIHSHIHTLSFSRPHPHTDGRTSLHRSKTSFPHMAGTVSAIRQERRREVETWRVPANAAAKHDHVWEGPGRGHTRSIYWARYTRSTLSKVLDSYLLIAPCLVLVMQPHFSLNGPQLHDNPSHVWTGIETLLIGNMARIKPGSQYENTANSGCLDECVGSVPTGDFPSFVLFGALV